MATLNIANFLKPDDIVTVDGWRDPRGGDDYTDNDDYVGLPLKVIYAEDPFVIVEHIPAMNLGRFVLDRRRVVFRYMSADFIQALRPQ